MWSTFYICSAILSIAIVLPGLCFLRAAHLSLPQSVGFAAPISLTLYSLLGMLYSATGISATLFTISMPVLVISALACIIRNHSYRQSSLASVKPNSSSCIVLLLYLVVGLLFVSLLFVKNLDGTSSFVQGYDNVTHLNIVQSLAEQRVFSITGTNFYQFSAPVLEGGYYPSLFHSVASLIVSSALHVTASMAINVTLFVALAVVFPLGIFSLLSLLFHNNIPCLVFGSVLCYLFATYPWRMLTFGPLYSNCFGMSLAPASIAAFISCFSSEYEGISFRFRLIRISLFVLSFICSSAAHPNTAFTIGLLLVPFCLYRIVASKAIKEINCSHLCQRLIRFACCSLFIILVLIIWMVTFQLPALQPVVGYTWDSFVSPNRAILGVALLQFNEPEPQVVLALLVYVGSFIIIRRYPSLRWTLFSALLFFVQYVISASTDGFIKQLLTGFWYTDSHRIAAAIPLCLLPAACLGVKRIGEYIWKGILHISDQGRRVSNRGAKIDYQILGRTIGMYYPHILCSMMVLLVVLVPINTFLFSRGDAFQAISHQLHALNTPTGMIDETEDKFLEQCKEIVGDSVVANNPDDGSVFGYGGYDIEVLYRTWGIADSASETVESVEIRSNMSAFGTDMLINNAAKDLKIEYVMVLDDYSNQEESLYAGINSVKANECFTLVLHVDDCYLYRLNS